MRMTEQEKQEFSHYVKELLLSEQVITMKNYIQHGNTTTLKHCLAVAYYSYLISLKLPLSLDRRSIVRGAMLHDFYLYDWHIPAKSHKFHGFVHPGIASKNARKYFKLSKIEIDIIERHMWPMTLHKFPTSKEVFLVCMVDKYCSLAETFYLPIISDQINHICEI